MNAILTGNWFDDWMNKWPTLRINDKEKNTAFVLEAGSGQTFRVSYYFYDTEQSFDQYCLLPFPFVQKRIITRMFHIPDVYQNFPDASYLLEFKQEIESLIDEALLLLQQPQSRVAFFKENPIGVRL